MILRKNGPCLRCLTVFQTGTSGYRKSEHQAPKAEAGEKFGRSREYRIGRAVCYYQWFSGRSYGEIFSVLSFSDLESLYSPLHEAVISKFAAIAEKRMRECLPETSLKLLRKICGCTEAELARLSGGMLRSVRRYEQRRKDINRAGAETLYRLSGVLGCSMKTLLEKPIRGKAPE